MILPLRERVREQVLRDVLEGRLEPGEQVHVAPLAERLSVSMTPAREALTQLEAEGWVILRPNRGFFVSPMTIEEASSIYPLLAMLEGFALELQTPPAKGLVADLQGLNRQMSASVDRPREALDLDRRWHERLVADCGNAILLDHLRGIRARAERYERAYMRYSGRLPTSRDDHEGIAAALESEPDRVPGMLREHWARSLEFVRDWLGEVDDGRAEPSVHADEVPLDAPGLG